MYVADCVDRFPFRVLARGKHEVVPHLFHPFSRISGGSNGIIAARKPGGGRFNAALVHGPDRISGRFTAAVCADYVYIRNLGGYTAVSCRYYLYAALHLFRFGVEQQNIIFAGNGVVPACHGGSVAFYDRGNAAHLRYGDIAVYRGFIVYGTDAPLCGVHIHYSPQLRFFITQSHVSFGVGRLVAVRVQHSFRSFRPVALLVDKEQSVTVAAVVGSVAVLAAERQYHRIGEGYYRFALGIDRSDIAVGINSYQQTAAEHIVRNGVVARRKRSAQYRHERERRYHNKQFLLHNASSGHTAENTKGISSPVPVL